MWYGSAAQNTVFQSSGQAPNSNAITTGGSKYINNGTAAFGFRTRSSLTRYIVSQWGRRNAAFLRPYKKHCAVKISSPHQ